MASATRTRPSSGQSGVASPYLSSSWNLFGELIGLEAGDNHPDTALEVTELGRARPGAGATVDWAASQLDDLARTLPAKSAVLYYAPLKDRLLGWVITPDNRRMFEQPIDADALAALVRNMDRLIQDSSD